MIFKETQSGNVKLKLTPEEVSVIYSIFSQVRLGQNSRTDFVFDFIESVNDMCTMIDQIPVTCDVTVSHSLGDSEFILNI